MPKPTDRFGSLRQAEERTERQEAKRRKEADLQGEERREEEHAKVIVREQSELETQARNANEKTAQTTDRPMICMPAQPIGRV